MKPENLIIYPLAFLCWLAHKVFSFDYKAFLCNIFDEDRLECKVINKVQNILFSTILVCFVLLVLIRIFK